MPRRIATHRPPRFASPTPATPDRDYDRNRRDPVLAKLYSSGLWQRFRAQIRRERALCLDCKARGRVTPGTEVHHLVDPREDRDLALDPSNVELVCKACHNAKRKSENHKPGGGGPVARPSTLHTDA